MSITDRSMELADARPGPEPLLELPRQQPVIDEVGGLDAKISLQSDIRCHIVEHQFQNWAGLPRTEHAGALDDRPDYVRNGHRQHPVRTM